jgi:hypothetical protein
LPLIAMIDFTERQSIIKNKSTNQIYYIYWYLKKPNIYIRNETDLLPLYDDVLNNEKSQSFFFSIWNR